MTKCSTAENRDGCTIISAGSLNDTSPGKKNSLVGLSITPNSEIPTPYNPKHIPPWSTPGSEARSAGSAPQPRLHLRSSSCGGRGQLLAWGWLITRRMSSFVAPFAAMRQWFTSTKVSPTMCNLRSGANVGFVGRTWEQSCAHGSSYATITSASLHHSIERGCTSRSRRS